VAAGILRVGNEDGEMNLADLRTKVLSGKNVGIFVGTLCGNEVIRVMPRFNLLRLASMRFTSRVNCYQWSVIGVLCLPLAESHREDVHYELGL
jgi:hypothetical protein